MNIPGFTASTSLYNTGGRYRASANRAGASATLGAVLPQMTRQQLDLPKESNPERARAIEDGPVEDLRQRRMQAAHRLVLASRNM